MPATEESAHADDFVSLPSISATTLLSRMAEAAITIIWKLLVYKKYNDKSNKLI